MALAGGERGVVVLVVLLALDLGARRAGAR